MKAPPRFPEILREMVLSSCRLDACFLTATPHGETDNSRFEGEKSVVTAPSDVFPGVDLGAPLADKDRSSIDNLSVMALEAQPFPNSVSAVGAAALSFLMCHRCPPVSAPRLAANGVDADFREVLTVTAKPSVVLFPLVMENPHLGFLAVSKDRPLDARGFKNGVADLDIAFVRQQKNLPQGHRSPGLKIHLLHPDDLAWSDPVLLPACFDHCIHVQVFLLPLGSRAAKGT